MAQWAILIIMFFIFAVLKSYALKREPFETASGAIVMALGIFLNGAADRLPLHEAWGTVFSICLFLVWVFMVSSIAKTAFQRKLKAYHMTDPIQSFAVGTWIAGTSVCAIAIAGHVPEWEPQLRGMAVIAVLLWVYYVLQSATNLRRMWNSDLYRKAQGLILLPTVSTQSIVLLIRALAEDFVPNWIYASMIAFGAGLYIIAFGLILKRYFSNRSWNIVDEWPNSNCILHGAMSITGLASAATGAFPPNIVGLIWLWVLLWVFVVESVECIRAVLRIKRYGFVTGIAAYHVSQWSRNFTFGMLCAFTLAFDFSRTTLVNVSVLRFLHHTVIDYGPWVVLALLVYQCLLFVKAKLEWGYRIHGEHVESNRQVSGHP